MKTMQTKMFAYLKAIKCDLSFEVITFGLKIPNRSFLHIKTTLLEDKKPVSIRNAPLCRTY